jgi:hypothetical protein
VLNYGLLTYFTNSVVSKRVGTTFHTCHLFIVDECFRFIIDLKNWLGTYSVNSSLSLDYRSK